MSSSPSAAAPQAQPSWFAREGKSLLAILGVFLTAGAVIAWLIRPPPPPPPKPPPPPPVMQVAGQPLDSSGDVLGGALDLVRRYAQKELVLKLPDGSEHKLLPALLGAEIDRVRLGELVRAALSPDSALRRRYDARREAEPGAVLAIPIPIHIDHGRTFERLLTIKDEVDRPATDAVVDVEQKKLRPEQWGFRLDVYGTLARIDAALRSGRSEVEAAVDKVKPRVVAAELGNVEFSHVLGYFETRYSQSQRWRARTYNLRQAASRLDGTVLLPGKIFDFNAAVGPRDEANGYKVAPVIAEGELVDGIGGGTCQISGTLHGAAFFAGLEIVERYPHSRPSYYIKLGLDATVVYPTINFRIRNPFDFPVVLHETVKSGVVRAEILGPKRKITTTFCRRVDEVTPFAEEIRETDELPRGKRVLAQRGVPGFKSTVFRVVREGAYAVRTKARNSYPPTTQIVKVGTGPADPEVKVKHDAHPEYVADEYLVITQGPKIRTPGVKDPEPGGGMVEARTPGLYGRAGWQQKLGMPVFEQDEDKEPDDADGDKKDTDEKDDKKPGDKADKQPKGDKKKDAAKKPPHKQR